MWEGEFSEYQNLHLLGLPYLPTQHPAIFFCGVMLSIGIKPNNLEQLKRGIRQAFSEITRENLENVFNNLVKRLDLCKKK